MNEQEFLTFARQEMARLAREMSGEDPASDRYTKLMTQMSNLVWLVRDVPGEHTAPAGVENAVVYEPMFGEPKQETGTWEPGGGEAVEEEPAPVEEEPAPATEEPAPVEEEPAVDRVALRAALAEAKSKGVNLSELLRQFGVRKYSDVPDDKLAELDRLRREAVEALG